MNAPGLGTSPATRVADATDIDRLVTHAIHGGRAICNKSLVALFAGSNGEVTCRRCLANALSAGVSSSEQTKEGQQ